MLKMNKFKYVFLTAVLLVFIGFPENGYAAKNEIYVIKVVGSINPGLAGFLKKGIEKASSDNVACIIIKLDTPGGLAESMREIVQDIFVNIWKNRKNLNIVSSFRSYLFSSVKNACLNQKKHILIREKYKEQNELNLNRNSISPETEFQTSELDIKIRETIDKLPLKRREIFILSRYDGLKYKEIADKLNISIKTVENQMGSALKFLRQELIDYLILFLLICLNIK